MTNRVCLKCHEQLRGRADQKFCSDQCRSSFNNLQYIESNNVIRNINRILKKNYYILCSFDSDSKITIPKSDLQNKGYRFDYFTFTCTSKSQKINYFVYDHGFREYDKDKVFLIRRKLNKDMTDSKT